MREKIKSDKAEKRDLTDKDWSSSYRIHPVLFPVDQQSTPVVSADMGNCDTLKMQSAKYLQVWFAP